MFVTLKTENSHMRNIKGALVSPRGRRARVGCPDDPPSCLVVCCRPPPAGLQSSTAVMLDCQMPSWYAEVSNTDAGKVGVVVLRVTFMSD
ncbi:hypothetical protein E2C01_071929 [Portunus trituberculatus]|uniref:Uncharacterized protein n=1 Tax=Portunus trituberculatus TaxID=210409 RepID=A0A5B7I5S1_PORTR|nr:hypothetical protein [Portunus trituberculatus]